MTNSNLCKLLQQNQTLFNKMLKPNYMPKLFFIVLTNNVVLTSLNWATKLFSNNKRWLTFIETNYRLWRHNNKWLIKCNLFRLKNYFIVNIKTIVLIMINVSNNTFMDWRHYQNGTVYLHNCFFYMTKISELY